MRSLLLVMVVLLGGCASQDVIKSANAYRALTSGSYHGAGLNERVTNCIYDKIDVVNRGSRCN